MRAKQTSTAFAVALMMSLGSQASAAVEAPKQAMDAGQGVPATSRLKPCTSVTIDDAAYVTLGKSTVIRLQAPVARMMVGGHGNTRTGQRTQTTVQVASPPPLPVTSSAGAAAQQGQQPGPAGAVQIPYDGVSDVDITLLSPNELFVLGRRSGAMNVVLQSANGQCHVKDIIVTIDPGAIQAKLTELMPEESGIKVRAAENAIILSGKVSDAIKLDEAMSLATSYGDGKKVVNMMRLTTPQQVMLEVKIAEVSKTLLDRIGSSVGINRTTSSGANAYSLVSSFLSGGGALLEAIRIGRAAVALDGQKDDGLVRVLAEPNIMAISGQQASFLSGGKIFIPVSQSNNASGLPLITLEEKEFGIGVKFTPTVLNGSRINLKMVSEVSDLSQTGSPFTTVGGVTSVLPSLTVRRADTTVQLNDGQSFVIAGLIKNNITETVKRFPGLGEIPVVGALARSSEFQNDQSELLFVITPRLVQPLAEAPRLPTDNHIVPTRGEVYLNGSLESAVPAPIRNVSETR